MISIVPFEPWHAAAIAVQPLQAPELATMTGPPGVAAALGPAFSALRQEGDAPPLVLCCAGLMVNHPEHATAWAMFACDKGAGMVAVTRAMMRVIAEADFRRVDMMVRSGPGAGLDGPSIRARDFATLLGFAREAVLGEVGVDGSDYEVWRLQRKGG